MAKEIKNILFNANFPDSAAARVCVSDLSLLLEKNGYNVAKNDWEYKNNYDVIFFMSPDAQVTEARKKQPNAIIGLIDPKVSNPKRMENMINADFLLVSSIEQRDKLLEYNKNIIIYYMFPDIKRMGKIHEAKDKIIIGYHGNKRHLENLDPDINWALEKLSEKYKIEFWTMFNIEELGEWKENKPAGVTTKEIQWSEENYFKYLSQCDIGIVPNQIPLNKFMNKILFSKYWKKYYKRHYYHKTDYVIRYKYSTNPGRIYVFSQLGIPVISDYSPSACQFLIDGQTGSIAGTREGWYYSLEKLIKDHQLRQTYANNLHNWIEQNYSIENNFNKLLDYIKNLKK